MRSWSDWPWLKPALTHLTTAPGCVADAPAFMFTELPKEIATHICACCTQNVNLRLCCTNMQSPWFYDGICLMKLACHEAELKWSTTVSSTLLNRLKDLSNIFSLELKTAHNMLHNYFSDLLLKMISSITNHPLLLIGPSVNKCKEFLSLFSNNLQDVRNEIIPLCQTLPDCCFVTRHCYHKKTTVY